MKEHQKKKIRQKFIKLCRSVEEFGLSKDYDEEEQTKAYNKYTKAADDFSDDLEKLLSKV